MDSLKLKAEAMQDLLWVKIADVWIDSITEIANGNFDNDNEDHQKCIRMMASTIKGELHMKGMHP